MSNLQHDDESTSSGLPANTPDGTDATADAPNATADAPVAPDGPIEGADASGDPDLVADADLQEGRDADPATDPSARERQDGI